MLALKEFVDFVVHHKSDLAETYARLLAEKASGSESLSRDQRVAVARKVLDAVVESFTRQNSAPLGQLFGERGAFASSEGGAWWAVECLGQTLTPIVTNLEAGKFLWQLLAEARAAVAPETRASLAPAPTGPVAPLEVEAALHESEERFRKLSEAAFEAIVITDKGKVLDVNEQFCRMYGYDRDEAIGKEAWEFVAPESIEMVQRYIQSGYEQPYEAVQKRKDGSVFPAQILGRTMVYQGRPARVTVVNDVSSYKRAEEELRATYERLELTISNMPVVFIEWDLEGRLTRWNKEATNIFGWLAEEALGQNIFDLLVPPEYHDNVSRVVENIRAGVSHKNVNENITKSGRRLVMEWYNELVRTPEGEIVGAASMGVDVTERVSREQATQASLERRTRQVQTSTEIAQEIAAAPALDELFRRVVNLVQERFGYYHAHVYTLDGENLVMQEGTGEAGRKLKATGHYISLDARKSLVARAARHAAAVLVSDVSQAPDWLPNPLLPDTKSELSVPIKLGSEMLGVLDVQSDRTGGLTEEDQLLLMGLCGQIAVAINTRRVETLHQQVQNRLTRQATQLETVVQVSTAASTILEVDKLLNEAVNLIRDRFDFYYVGLFLVDEAGAWAVRQAGTGEAGRTQLRQGHRLQIGGESMIGWSIHHRRARIALDVGEEAVRFVNPILPDTRSEMALPLISRGQVIGALTVQSVLPSAFSDEDVTSLQAMTDQLANAIANARLFEQTQRQARREQTIRKITDRLRRAPDMETLLEIGTTELARVLNPARTFVQLGQPGETAVTHLKENGGGDQPGPDGV